jgi:hypothetical protein
MLKASWRLLRQFALLLSLMFWQGGFLFYSSVVIPAGANILRSETEQGFITQSVTNYLNLAGGVCLGIWLINLVLDANLRCWSARAAWTVWLLLVLGLCALGMIHVRMDDALDFSDHVVINDQGFYALHRIYLLVSSLQLVGALGLVIYMMKRWQFPQTASAEVHRIG